MTEPASRKEERPVATSAPSLATAIAPDLEAVGRFLKEMLARGAIVELVSAVLALLGRMRDLNTELMAKLAQKSRKRPPSETMRRLQLELPLLLGAAANDSSAAKGDAKTATPAGDPPQKKKRGAKNPRPHGRPKLPPHLPRVPEPHRVPDEQRTCPHCGGTLETIGFKAAEKLDVEPSKYVIRQCQRETCACQSCHGHIVTAPRQDEVLDRGILGNELLVQALVDHYDDAVPWERMERNARQEGVPLAANTLAASVGRVIDLFDPIVEHIKEACLASSFTALDATSMPVLDPKHPLGIRTGALWLIDGDHRYSYFAYAPSGHGTHLDALLEGCKLASVMCDGSPTNNGVERAGGKRGGCSAHARRRLVEVVRSGDARATRGLELFAALFHVEAESKRAGESVDIRFERRQRESAPLVEKLRMWMEIARAEAEPKSKLGNAVGYMHRQWKRLTAFLRDPRMELTNNEVERDLRRWVLDRKTWLFVGHEQSARRAADALTLLSTCRKMGIEPRRYLRETLGKILAGEKELVALLPETFARALAVERVPSDQAAAA